MGDDVADQINSGYFLAPGLVGEGEIDPLLAQALQNVADEAEDAAAAVEARKAPPLPPLEKPQPRALDPGSTPDFRALLVELVRILGRRYVAVIGGATRTGLLADWIHGFAMPTAEHVARLKLAFSLVQTLRKHLDDRAVEQWFLTRNDLLDGQMPIALLVLQPSVSTEERLRSAATTT